MEKHIFVIHKGNHDYFKECIKSIQFSNPDAIIHVFGDERNAGIPGVDHIDYENYKDGMDFKLDNYVHLSPNSEPYERICLDRYFVIYDYMKKNNVPVGFHMDSDVLLNVYLDDKYYNGKFNYCRNCGGTMIFTLKQIEDFCKLIKHYYTDPRCLESLKELYNIRTAKGMAGGVSDMTFFNLYVMEYTEEAHDMSRFNHYECFDYFFGNPEGYEPLMGKAKIYCKNGKYYYRHMLTNKFIQINSLHCGAKDKMYMIALNHRPEGEGLWAFDFNTLNWVDGTKEIAVNQIKSKAMKLREIKYHIRKKIESIIALKR